MSEEIQDKAKANVLRQIEYYFGDSNFRRDKFMLAKAKENEEGLIPINVLLTFKKLSGFVEGIENPASFIADVMASSEVVVVSEAKDAIRRRHPLPEEDDSAA
eukprot:CAMPEP_0113951298 /NCGR_PEP_ID=MMETSP1339-20121228/85374_1 /TAXON_ID=94617 /ORGANISM="Fibrocapsa japonica" /LENGTH=102 /DNA_ID=CAMNT_0000959495 /DNA_START=24 /DNA_END=328 /DNA_ORIENTATION=- /assembly_acc=CAM_ASM_000762